MDDGRCPLTAVRVFFSSSGNVSLNGKPTKASDLARAINALSPRPSAICYARENPNVEPHPNVSVVLDAMVETKLPIALFPDKTYTNAMKFK
jgi:hypothetical protein